MSNDTPQTTGCVTPLFKAIAALRAELLMYREAALYDPLMSGEAAFKGWDRSALDRARKVTEERIRRESVNV